MKILILGIDGYLGWALAVHLAKENHEIAGIDKYYRRKWVEEVGSVSAIPIQDMTTRLNAYEENFSKKISFFEGDLTEYSFVESVFKEFQPEAIVHLGEMPSAPYSMIDVKHATWTQTNNIVGNLNVLYAMRDVVPEAHLIKLGTMGEYGTPNVDIPEGFFEIEFNGRKDILPFPRQAGSWYHQSKVHDSHNIMMACKQWKLCSTDIMQGIVFGSRIAEMGDDERLNTRLDFDQCFGTAINRFTSQAVIGHPITLYGSGEQKRGFLPLRDVMQCLTLAIQNPPEVGEYRVFNQFDKVYGISEVAEKVRNIGVELGLDVDIIYSENPRKELESHRYNPIRERLISLGYEPSNDIDAVIREMLVDLKKHRKRIEEKRDNLVPDIHWTGEKKKVTFFSEQTNQKIKKVS